MYDSITAMNDSEFSWWLVGLVDGEGHLGVTRFFKTNGSGPYYRCVFRVVMAVDDRALLETACQRTGWGKLYQYNRTTHKSNGSVHRPFVVWTVNTKAQIPAVVEFFRKHPLQSKKQIEFEHWAKAATAFASRRRLGRGKPDVEANAVLEAAYIALQDLRRY